MTKSNATLILLACSALMAAGCKMPQAGQQGNTFHMPGSPALPAMPGYHHSADAQFVGDVDPATIAATTPRQEIVEDSGSIAQVGFCSPGGPSCNDDSACGSSACGPAACATPPHGYAMPAPQFWNAYGIDPQEFLCDGGDAAPAAIVRRDDSIGGLDLEDTVVHYTTDKGDIEIQASNRACLYAPRFASVRKITGAVAGGRAITLAQMDRPVGAIRFEQQQPGLVMTDTVELGHADVARRIDAMRERNRGVRIENVLQPELAGEVLEAMAGISIVELRNMTDQEKALFEQLALAAVAWDLDESVEVVVEDLRTPTLVRDEHLRGLTIYEFPDAGRLSISKLADRGDALPGEIVTFSIRIQNVGDSAVSDIVLADNLTTRLEYVYESQQCTVDAEFETAVNEGESLKLQWTFVEPLEVGEEATITFQCKVR